MDSIGAHCSLSSCNLNDFLPIRCRCSNLFCRDHILPDSHQCPLLNQSIESLNSDSGFAKLEKCAFGACKRPSLESFVSRETKLNDEDENGRVKAVCERCGGAFCALHRTPSSHSCTSPDPSTLVSPKNIAAKALLVKHFPSSSSATSSASSSSSPSTTTMQQKKKKPLTPQQLKIQAIKMRHKAQPGDPKDKSKDVSFTEKVHLNVSVSSTIPDVGGEQIEKVVWFRKSIGTGKALDCLASLCGFKSSVGVSTRTFDIDI
ncbi:hypothetical protein C8Q75DRAFT_714014 [Abortiporus biennis]|nr:hypothetical protein C8Q75DRAFT_714014 [Abortiporus biennis]